MNSWVDRRGEIQEPVNNWLSLPKTTEEKLGERRTCSREHQIFFSKKNLFDPISEDSFNFGGGSNPLIKITINIPGCVI